MNAQQSALNKRIRLWPNSKNLMKIKTQIETAISWKRKLVHADIRFNRDRPRLILPREIHELRESMKETKAVISQFT